MPQLNPAFFSMQLFWLVVTFVILLLLMTKVALPKLGKVIEDRADRINGDIAAAKAARDAAESLMASTEQSLVAARREGQQALAEAQAKIDATAKAREAELAAKLASEATAAEARIGAAKKAALDNVRTVATEVAAAAASKLLGVGVSETEAGSAVDQSLRERA